MGEITSQLWDYLVAALGLPNREGVPRYVRGDTGVSYTLGLESTLRLLAGVSQVYAVQSLMAIGDNNAPTITLTLQRPAFLVGYSVTHSESSFDGTEKVRAKIQFQSKVNSGSAIGAEYIQAATDTSSWEAEPGSATRILARQPLSELPRLLHVGDAIVLDASKSGVTQESKYGHNLIFETPYLTTDWITQT